MSDLWRDSTTSHKHPINFEYGKDLIRLGLGYLVTTSVIITQLKAAGYSNSQMFKIFREVRLENEMK